MYPKAYWEGKRRKRKQAAKRQQTLAQGVRTCERIDDMSLWAHSPPREEGWSLTNHFAECILESWLVSDHPVCGGFGGFAAFLLKLQLPLLTRRGMRPERTAC